MQHVFIVGAKGFTYGGYETFLDKLTEYHQNNENIKYHTNTMMVELGVTLHFAAGSDKNIKLTTKDDLEMFKAYLKADKDNWLK